ncbi:hypothetical protein M409DRAFT_56142 [Zasmidium cellare ATCC 36951]|uniref:Uncharacterized protein n=1 Tax=Zasmidium cellare ATCC 36951 TaxID=1080233 RepID=A0A6A6CDI2_ZASCE|nr:uncharacterized protein M409DRAFT_56142 [Zasmidium cellare ATCC 36951]KAF2165277.1 hypothetical protein M409DRAFT_56142 [Zasmidium cellare ATCC 36951]
MANQHKNDRNTPTSSKYAGGTPEHQNGRYQERGGQWPRQEQGRRDTNSSAGFQQTPQNTPQDVWWPHSPAPWTSPQPSPARKMTYWYNWREFHVQVPGLQTYVDLVRGLRHPNSSGRCVATKSDSAEMRLSLEAGTDQQGQGQIAFDGLVVSEESSSTVKDGETRRWSY